MPFVAPQTAKCPKCGKSVYAAEEKVAGGLKFHKMCFKCDLCNKMLESTNVTEHENKLYCKQCYGRKFGPKGYGFGGGAGCLSMDTGEHVGNVDGSIMSNKPTSGPAGSSYIPPGAERCGRCGKAVYAAEKRTGGGKSWHKGCFNCADCHKSLESGAECVQEAEIYCKTCYGRSFGPKGVGFGGGAGCLSAE